MYRYHKDHPNQKWNVFQVLAGMEFFIRSFDTLEEARDFCIAKNRS